MVAVHAVTYCPIGQALAAVHSWHRLLLFLKYGVGMMSHAQVQVLIPAIK